MHLCIFPPIILTYLYLFQSALGLVELHSTCLIYFAIKWWQKKKKKTPTTIICIVFWTKLVMTSKSKMLQIKTRKKNSANYMKIWGRTPVVLYVISMEMLELCWVSHVTWFCFCLQIILWEVNSEIQFVHLGWYVW